MTVRTHDGMHFLSDKVNKDAVLSVTLDRALQLVSRNRVMLFYFPLMDHYRTYLGEFALGTLYPFVLLRLARGPNFDGGLDDYNLFEPQTSVNYFVGFAEAKGTRWTYSEDDVDELVNVLKKLDDGYRSLGVFLSAEFLSDRKGVWQFKRLLDLSAVKWLYVRSGKIITNKWNPTDTQVENLKWNIRAFQKETYIHTDWNLRQKIYKWENIPDPEHDTTTMPPITGSTISPGSTGSTGSTETTTTTTTTEAPPSIDDITLTSEEPSKPTPSFTSKYTDVTFPTVVVPSGTTARISHPMLGALFYLLWGNWGY